MHRGFSRSITIAGLAVALCLPNSQAFAQKGGGGKKDAKKTKEVWTDVKDASLPLDFAIQGEYVGATKSGKVGVQIIALGKGQFQAVVFAGGLPGDGWNGVARSLMQGSLEGDKALFAPAEGKRKYIAQKPEEFSATAAFPPKGHAPHSGVVSDGKLTLKTPSGPAEPAKVQRKSPTLGKQAPDGAIVLFDGKDTAEWNRGRLDKENGILNTDGGDVVSKRKFNNYTMHIEFMLPYRPDARGQGRGNSGFYQVDHYEAQILDSFGLEGKNNETGGIYTKSNPKVNMCLPPLQWQTYDVDFTNAIADEKGKKVKNARVTLRLNGVVVQDDLEITGPTGGGRSEPEATPGPIKLQGHGNPLQFRNIWIVERK